MIDGTDNSVESINDLDSAFDFAFSEDEGESTEVGEDIEATDADAEVDDDSTDTDTDDEGVTAEDDSEGDIEVESDEDDDRYVVKVDGEEIEVSLDELAKGYQRQADYTRKTQALAQEREELAALRTLADALRDNPQTVVRSLAERFGVSLSGATVDNTVNGVELDPNDPIEGELLRMRQHAAEMEQKFATLESQAQARTEDQRKAEVLQQIEEIKRANNDPDLDPVELLQFAVERQVGDLQIAYMAMRSHKPEPPSIRKIKAKRSQPPVAGGAHRAGVKHGATPDKRMSLEEALAEALSVS